MSSSQEHFLRLEEKDGVRFSLNVFPSTRLEATRVTVPVALMYTPMKQLSHVTPVDYRPIFCSTQTCGSVLNPYCRIDFMNKIWICPFCARRNHFPPQYNSISSEKRPAEIMPQYTTMEYIIDNTMQQPPVFLFVVDLCLDPEELEALKSAIVQNLMLLPEEAFVGLITFGKNVHVHELGFEECPKTHVIQGRSDRPETYFEVAKHLDLPPRVTSGNSGDKKKDAKSAPTSAQWTPLPGAERFIMPLSECEMTLTAILDGLSVDCWGHESNMRPLRHTGAAIAVASNLLEATFKGIPSRIMVFTGGACTAGPGIIVSDALTETIRSHHDIQKNTAPYYKKAMQFYENLASRTRDNGHIIDMFAASLDQLGLAELKVCFEKTGGCMVLDDSFARGVFSGSFQGMFRRDADDNLKMGFMGELQVLTSSEFKVAGAIGQVSSMERKHSCVADTPMGVGNTCAWKLGGLDPNTTLALYFEITSTKPPENRQAYLQMCTKYTYSTGRTHLRVTTLSQTFVNPAEQKGLSYIRMGFDQECAAVIMSRLAVHKATYEYAFDVLRWVDRMLIRVVKKFATYTKDSPDSFKLSSEFSYYPQFMFHLRRSQFLQIFNCSPDETAFYRLMLIRENVANSINMIQPSLIAYSLDGPAQAVMLDAMSCQPNRILVLDTFFHIVVWYGSTIAKWRENGVHLKPEYDYFAQLLTAPVADAQEQIKERFPYPMFIECLQNGSQERFLLAKLNPSVTHTTENNNGEQAIFTEDVSFKIFMKHLRRLTVAE